MGKAFNLALCIPSGPDWSADFGLSVGMMMLALNRKPAVGFETNLLKIFNSRSSLLPKNRHELAEKALNAGCSHLLFVDSDQTFPAFTAHRLASHDVDVVACNIAIKSIPSSPTARNFSKQWWGGETVFTDQKKGLEKVWRIGMGVMMVKAEVFQKIPKPWFEVRYRPEVDSYTGEDWFFCERLEEYGIPIHIDHSLSREVGHVGVYTYTHDVIGAVVEQEKREEKAVRFLTV